MKNHSFHDFLLGVISGWLSVFSFVILQQSLGLFISASISIVLVITFLIAITIDHERMKERVE